MFIHEKEPAEMYTIDVFPDIYDPEKGKLGSYVVIRKIKNSEHVDADNIEVGTYVFPSIEAARKEMHKPECSRCGLEFKEDDKLYYGGVDYFVDFPEADLHCQNCKRANRVAQEL